MFLPKIDWSGLRTLYNLVWAGPMPLMMRRLQPYNRVVVDASRSCVELTV